METDTFKFECPKCSQKLSVREAHVGKTLRCPSCKAEIVVPNPNLPPPYVPSLEEPPTPPKSRATELYTLWINDENAGPYTLGQLRSMWASGKITAKTRYWKKGSTEWKRLMEIAKELDETV